MSGRKAIIKLLPDIVHSPDDSHMDSVEKAKLELQRYLSDVITDQYDQNGHLDHLKWCKLNCVVTHMFQYLQGSICQHHMLQLHRSVVLLKCNHLINILHD